MSASQPSTTVPAWVIVVASLGSVAALVALVFVVEYVRRRHATEMQLLSNEAKRESVVAAAATAPPGGPLGATAPEGVIHDTATDEATTIPAQRSAPASFSRPVSALSRPEMTDTTRTTSDGASDRTDMFPPRLNADGDGDTATMEGRVEQDEDAPNPPLLHSDERAAASAWSSSFRLKNREQSLALERTEADQQLRIAAALRRQGKNRPTKQILNAVAPLATLSSNGDDDALNLRRNEMPTGTAARRNSVGTQQHATGSVMATQSMEAFSLNGTTSGVSSGAETSSPLRASSLKVSFRMDRAEQHHFTTAAAASRRLSAPRANATASSFRPEATRVAPAACRLVYVGEAQPQILPC